MITQPDSGYVAVRAGGGEVRLHLLRDPSSLRDKSVAFGGAHPSMCGRRTFAEAMPESTDITRYRECGACRRAVTHKGVQPAWLAARDHAADGGTRRK